MRLAVKICGVRTPEALAAAYRGGARMVGLNFYPPSPRYVDVAVAAELWRHVPTGLGIAGVFVDPSDALLDATLSHVPLSLLQLHGAETPARVQAIKARTLLPVIKALRVHTSADIARAQDYPMADWLLFDAKAPPGVSSLPGGTGLSFDWSLLHGQRFAQPWLLAGGLTAANLAEAARQSGAPGVDVVSGVEERPGTLSPLKIKEFLNVAAGL